MTASGASTEPPGSWEWAACGASVIGADHLAMGQGCDDAYAFGVADDFTVAAVADGAGSVTGTSAHGAYAACRSVVTDALAPGFSRRFHSASSDTAETMMRWLFEQALHRVRERATAMGVDVARLATTLSVAIANNHGALFAQIGDGVISMETDDGAISTLLIESKAEYANITRFLQSDGAFEDSLPVDGAERVRAFALSTDGMRYKITNVATGEAYQPFFRDAWRHVRSGVNSANFTSLLRNIEDDQTGDDKTMVLIARRWEDDEFHPSPRPERWTVVSSAAPVMQRESAPPPKISRQPSVPSADTETDPIDVGAESSRRRLRPGRRRRR